MNRLPLLVLAALLCVTLVGAPADGKEAKGFNEKINTFKKAMRSKDPTMRMRAFDFLRDVKDPIAIKHLVWGVKEVAKIKASIHKAQAENEAKYEDLINAMHAAQAELEVAGNNQRAMKAFNKKERRISKARDGCIKRGKNLENDHTRNRSLMQQAVLTAEEIMSSLQGDDMREALTELTAKWLQSKHLEDKLRWVDAVGDIQESVVLEYLHTVVDSEELPIQVRVATVNALANQGNGQMLQKAIEWLTFPPEKSMLIVAALTAIRQIHDRRSIPAVIKFLERMDLKNERMVASSTLRSLTAKAFGPYASEWKKWWEDNQKTFTMPKSPKRTGVIKKVDTGKTFYGIHTFSDRILYIVDMSGSMDRAEKIINKKDGTTVKTGKTKWEVCKQELTGSVFGLNVGDGFNILFFNHQVIPWQNRKALASEKTKRMVKKWVEEQVPLGGTNIYDSLERGFQMAAFGVTGGEKPPIDTIFFLTDGKPTAGKVKDPKYILEIIREWNEVAKLTIHCIGIGADHDAEFMKELARIGDGQYVSR